MELQLEGPAADTQGVALGFSTGSCLRAATAALVLLASVGCEYFVSDVATRIRYALIDAVADAPAEDETVVLRLRPDHWPDGCPGDGGYTLTVSPYRGGKQVPVGDIGIRCRGRGSYGTGFGSERIRVATDLSVDKRRDEDLEIVLRGRADGLDIVALR